MRRSASWSSQIADGTTKADLAREQLPSDPRADIRTCPFPTPRSSMSSSSNAPSGEVIVHVFGRTDVGRTREHNEDAFVVADLSTRQRDAAAGSAHAHRRPKGLAVHGRRRHGRRRGRRDRQRDGGRGRARRAAARAWLAEPATSPEAFVRAIKHATKAANEQINAYAGDASRVPRHGHHGDDRRTARRHALSRAGRRQPRVSRARRRGATDHERSVADAEADRGRRAHRGRSRAERAAQHHSPGARPRAVDQGRSHAPDGAPRRHARAVQRRIVRPGDEGRDRARS